MPASRLARSMTCAAFAGTIGLVTSLFSTGAQAGQHPRLLVTADDLPRLRHACGVGVGAPAGDATGRAGARAAEFQALRQHLAEREGAELLPGELSAAAFLHLVDPGDPLDFRRTRLINGALQQAPGIGADPFELVVALDWCWDVLEADVRREFLFALRKRAQPLTPADSPLDHRIFAERLVTLAAILAFDEQDEASATWTTLRKENLAAARQYFEHTFPAFVRWRGRSPTSPSAGPWEERDTALAVELAGAVLGRTVWPEYRDSVGRWLEHYVFASFAHPALQHHFIRDDGNLAPLLPAPRWDELLPVTAHLIAARTQDPAAAFIARRVEQRLRGPGADPLAIPWQWVPIVFETAALRRCDFARLSGARNLGGAVVFRGNHGSCESGIWIEAGQPFLRRRQHFDAGHFVIHSGGPLTVSGGDDIWHEATPAKGGQQRLGRGDAPFSFEQYFVATIAHNCVLLWDPVRVPRWYGELYEPTGGQRLVEETCTDFAAPLDGHARQTARQLAYGQRANAAYLALDLLPAYESRAAAGYTREFLFLSGRVLLVIDRINGPRSRIEPVWLVNIPGRPTVDGQDLPDSARIEGSDAGAGVWRLDAARWFRWTGDDGCLWFRPLAPDARQVFAVGGPARRLAVSDGPHAGRTYVGGDADGFEHLVRPASHARPKNAWYRLGQPTVLGPAFGIAPHWGRIEVHSVEKSDKCVFVTAFVIGAADDMHPPGVELTRTDKGIRVALDANAGNAIVALVEGATIGGEVEFVGGEAARWSLPATVEDDPALPSE